MATKELIQKIKVSTNIVDIIGEQVQLKQAGNRLKGLSPFSQEKSPSFFVNPDLQLYYCFSTNQGGDVIDFIVQTRGLDFQEALAWLAEKKGIFIPKNALESRVGVNSDKKQAELRAYKLNRYVANFFQEQLESKEGAGAKKYLTQRGVSLTSQRNFGLGFAPPSWNQLRNFLVRIKAPLPLALELGLLKKSTKNNDSQSKGNPNTANLYDAFRNRIIFPIRNGTGEIVGFGGRTLDPQDPAKYLNSSESSIYKKGELLYNWDRARRHLREKQSTILVEGYMDCIAMDQAGIPNVVAMLGTSLTSHHVHFLSRSDNPIISIYDADTAGKKAALRSMDLFLQISGFPLTSLFLPDSKDPDEFLKTHGSAGPAKLRKLIHHAPATIDTWIDGEIGSCAKSLQSRVDCLNRIGEKLGYLKDPLWIQARISNIANRLLLEEALVEATVWGKHRKKAKNMPNTQKNTQKKPAASQKMKTFLAQSDKNRFERRFEIQFLSYLFGYSKWLPELRERFQKDALVLAPFLENEEISQAVNFLIQPLRDGETENARLGDLMENLSARNKTQLRNVIALATVPQKGVVREGEEPLLKHALQKLYIQESHRNRKKMNLAIHQAELEGNISKYKALQKELIMAIKELKIRLEKLND